MGLLRETAWLPDVDAAIVHRPDSKALACYAPLGKSRVTHRLPKPRFCSWNATTPRQDLPQLSLAVTSSWSIWSIASESRNYRRQRLSRRQPATESPLLLGVSARICVKRSFGGRLVRLTSRCPPNPWDERRVCSHFFGNSSPFCRGSGTNRPTPLYC